MKRILLAAALCATSAMAAAQQPAEQPPGPKCEPRPQRPSQSLLNDPRVRHNFERDVKAYGECMKKYIEEHKAIALAHHNAANAAIEEYNRTVESLNAQGASGGASLGTVPPKRGY